MKVSTWKATLSKLLFAGMVILSIAIITPTIAFAASTPALTKTSCNVLVGKKYDINVKNGIAKSTYTWSSNNKKVATVDKAGVVKGISKGTAVISCKVKTPKKTYTLKCTVTIIKPATSVKINNKVTALNVGQVYDLNATLSPASSNDKVVWKSSNSKIASPDKNGRFTAKKEGTVTISATTVSGKKATVKIKVVDVNGTVTNQSELNALLGSGVSLITIKTDAVVNLSIAKGDYSKKNLVVDAPKAEITNEGKFASINIKQIKSDTWIEKAEGNVISVSATGARIVIAEGASVSIEATTKGAVIKVENNGKVEELTLPENANIEIAGTSKQVIPITVAVPGVKINSSVPLELECKVKIDLTLQKGAESTKVQVATRDLMPTLTGDVTIPITIGTGADAKTEPLKGTPIPVIIGGGTPGGYTPGGNNPGSSVTSFIFNQAITDVSSISINYGPNNYTMDGFLLDLIQSFAANEAVAVNFWNIMTDGYQLNSNGDTVVFHNVSASTKTVTINSDSIHGKTYSVTLNNSHSITISSASLSVTVIEDQINKTFTVQTSHAISVDYVLDTFPNALSYYSDLNSVSVTYKNLVYTADSNLLTAASVFALAPQLTYEYWIDPSHTNYTMTVNNSLLTINGVGATKSVTYNNKTYSVTVNSTNQVIVSNANGMTVTANRGTTSFSIDLN